MDSSGRGAGGLAEAAASLRAAPASWRKLSSPSPRPLVFPPLSAAVALGTVSFGLPRIGTQDSFMGMQWWGGVREFWRASSYTYPTSRLPRAYI